MVQKLPINEVLKTICPNVHFNPPEGSKLVYPCIVYNLDTIEPFRADGRIYVKHRKYTVTIIDRNPLSQLPDMLLELPYCNHDRTFVNDNLVHFVFTLYSSNDGWLWSPFDFRYGYTTF